jgi:hypothetical protein
VGTVSVRVLRMRKDRSAVGLRLVLREVRLPLFDPEEDLIEVVDGLNNSQDNCLCPLLSGDNNSGSIFWIIATVFGDRKSCCDIFSDGSKVLVERRRQVGIQVEDEWRRKQKVSECASRR